MKKGIITVGALAITALTITFYCRAVGNEVVLENVNVAPKQP